MLAMLSDVVRNIVVLIILVTILDLLLPRNQFRPFVNMVVGLVLMLMLLTPIRSMIQMPGALDPVWEMRLALSEDDVAARQAIMDQLNWDLALEQYRDLVYGKIVAVMEDEGYVVEEMTLNVEEDASHVEFGYPRQITVVVQREEEPNDGFGQVEEIKIELGQEPLSTPAEEKRSSRLEQSLARSLEVSEEIVAVYVLNVQ